MNTQKESVKQHILNSINDQEGCEASELHHRLLNEDYFIIGTYEAKQWLGEETFDCIELIKEYEQDNFGEVNTDLSDPERVCNMTAYILGEQILNESSTLQEQWDTTLTKEDLATIEEELNA